MLCWAADFHEMGNIHDICLLFTSQVSAAEPDTRHAILSLATKFNMFFFLPMYYYLTPKSQPTMGITKHTAKVR